MSFYVRIVDGAVKDCWDTPPPQSQEGWKTAIEVRPEITPGRQRYTRHTFDITKDPVEIVYGVEDISLNDRKQAATSKVIAYYHNVLRNQQELDPALYNPALLQAAKDTVIADRATINACTTHEELDAALNTLIY
jgi:hypothetical protein